MKRHILLAILCLWGLAGSAQITLQECQKWARENYPEVKRYDIISATEACNLKNASQNWLPMVSLKALGGWTNSTANLNDFADGLNVSSQIVKDGIKTAIYELGIKAIPNWQYRAGVEVVQPIYDGGAISLQKELARRQADADKAKIEVSLHSLDDKVVDVYFAIMLLEDRKIQASNRMELLDKNLDKLHNLLKEDVVKQNDVDAVEVEKLKAQQAIDVLDENIEIYRKTLSLLTGQQLADKKLIRPQMPSTERQAYSETAEMQLLNSQSQLLSLKERYEKVKTLPKVGLLGQAYYGYPGTNIFRDLISRNPQLNMGVALNVTWDITSFFKKNNNLQTIKQQQATIDNARELLIYRQNITNVSLETKLKRLKNITKQDDQIIELRERLRKAEEVKLDNDMVDATELLSKINDESDAKLQRSIHESELMLDIYKLNLYGDTRK